MSGDSRQTIRAVGLAAASVAGVLALVVFAGCNVYHLRKNAPGHLPRDSERIESARTGDQVRPEDPGERAVEVLVGPTVEFGGPLEASGSSIGHSTRLGGELTLHYLGLEKSHSVVDWGLASDFQAIRTAFREATPYRIAPRMNLGSTWDFASDTAGFYAEGGIAHPGKIGWTAGYESRPAADASSIRSTMTLWGLFRFQYTRSLTGRGDAVFVGLSLRSAHTIVWSR